MPDSSSHLGPVETKLRDSSEEFRVPGDYGRRAPTLGDYWQWSSSDVLNNTDRGKMAEFLVAHALGLTEEPRTEWDSVDLRTRAGIKIEIKSAAYLQSWRQSRHSQIGFGIGPKKRAWDAEKDRSVLHDPPKRVADIYVFCLLKHKEKSTVNPLDTDQWEFYVVPTWRIDKERSGGKRIGLRPLRDLAQGALGFSEIADAVTTLEQRILSGAEDQPASFANDTAPANVKVGRRRSKLTEAEFFQLIERNLPELPSLIKPFIERYKGLGRGFRVRYGTDSLILDWVSRSKIAHNFGTIFTNGDLYTDSIVGQTKRSGDENIGIKYLEDIRGQIPGATVLKTPSFRWWRVAKEGPALLVANALEISDQWLMAISRAVEALNNLTGDD